ncbi:MAG: hypothetical protein JNJ55_00925 [Betaproteobacteria bacterium]|nr:hypothetical protein [Betaproteobacteria bacterium]
MLSLHRNFQSLSLIAAILLAFSADSRAKEPAASELRAMPQWSAGDKATYQVQQVVKERVDGKEETRFLSNGTVEIAAAEINADAVTLTWHRRMDNAALELVREPWGIRGNGQAEKLVSNLIREGLAVKVRLDLRTQRVTVLNREELMMALRRSLQAASGNFAGDASGRYRAQTPNEQSNREPTRAQLGIHQPLVRRDNSKQALTPKSAGALTRWYTQLVRTEIVDFLGALGREYTLENASVQPALPIRSYRPTGASEVLLTLSNAPSIPEAPKEEPSEDAPAVDDELVAENAGGVGLSGGALLPAAYEAKIELAIPSGWPKRAAIVRTETESNAADAKRTTQRRVYLRQAP